MVLQGWPATVTVWFLKCLVLIHDIITLPIYFFIDKPWQRWKTNKIIWAKLEDEHDPYSCYVRQKLYDEPPTYIEYKTLSEVFDYSVAKFGDRHSFGVREVFGEEETIKSGKVFKKLSLGEYKWTTYNEANERVGNISRGLLALGIQSKTPVAVFAETRLEWFLTAQACFRINAPIVTVYATLGDESLVHCMNETEVKYIITSQEQLPKLKDILHRTSITHVICMKGVTGIISDDISDNVKFIKFDDLEEMGTTNVDVSFTPPSTDDLAVIMYTSGSTGVPKGVLITHKNMSTGINGVTKIHLKTFMDEEDNSYIAYLPLAHVLELIAECQFSSLGVKIGFSSPQTLTDYSTAVKKGEKGDLSVLKPTMVVAVPLMLNRIRNSILQLSGKEGTFSRMMLHFAISYKTFWSDLGFQTPRLDRNLLKQYKDFMGGNVKRLVCGSAPLAVETQTFIQCILSCRVYQGYGLTESAGVTCIMDDSDYSAGTVGAPTPVCKVRLVDWVEGRYFVTDKPNPRGEVVISGDSLSVGYYKMEDATNEAYKIEKGERWFYTGDIGEILPNGTLKIIDRKKDLVKLQFGEYVALGKVEAQMKISPLVENICVFGTFQKNYLIALVIPNRQELKMVAKDVGKSKLSYEEMCSDKEITQKFEDRLKEHAKQCHLFGSEIPQKIKLCSDEWTPESGLVTAALKLRRKQIENHYMDIIQRMYKENSLNGVNSR